MDHNENDAMQPLARGVTIGGAGALVAVGAVLGWWFADDDMARAAATSAVAAAVLVALALWARRRRARTAPAPITEYGAAVYTAVFYAALAVSGETSGSELADSLLILPPVGPVPLAARFAIGDDGHPSSPGRRAARWLHRLFAWGLLIIGGLFAISLLFIIAAPFSLIAGTLHLLAAREYAAARRSSEDAASHRD